jgi:type IV pilus assembly protein PilN
MVTINLLPIKAELRRKALIQHVVVLGLFLVLLVLGLGAMQTSITYRRDNLQKEIVDTKEEIKALTIKAGEIEDFKKRKQELERKLDIIKELNTKKSGPVQMLDEISLIVPDKVWIKSMNIAANKVVLDGGAIDSTVIAEFMKKLQSSEHFSDVELVLVEQEGMNQRYTIQCKVKQPA